MKLIAEKKGPRDKADLLRFVRRDGSTSQCALPRQGTLPHDLIHYVVESRLPLRPELDEYRALTPGSPPELPDSTDRNPIAW